MAGSAELDLASEYALHAIEDAPQDSVAQTAAVASQSPVCVLVFGTGTPASFTVPVSTAKRADFLCAMLEADETGSSEREAIPLPQIHQAHGALLVSFLETIVAHPMPVFDRPLKRDSLLNYFGDDYVHYKKFSEGDLADILVYIHLGNFMGVKEMVELAGARFALFIRGKLPEQIFKELGGGTEFTEAEENAIQTENELILKALTTSANKKRPLE